MQAAQPLRNPEPITREIDEEPRPAARFRGCDSSRRADTGRSTRRDHRHPLKWEFPGGKVEPGESPQQALVRELREELQIEARIGSELARYEHEYPSGSRVHLLFFAVSEFTGEPKARVFEQIRWTDLERLEELDFLEGDLDFVKRLARGDFGRQLKQ